MENKYIEIRNILLFILILNLGVSAAKIFYGIISKSISMTADGFHSLADGTSNIIGLVGIFFASKPIDKEHPYGHKKFETFTTLAISVLLFMVFINLIKSLIDRIHNPIIPNIDTASFIVMFITLAVNIWVVYYETKKGKELMSDFLVSDAMHTKSDILMSLSVIASLIGAKLGIQYIDIFVAVIISFLIAKAAFEILKESASILCDATAIDETQIANIVMENCKVESCHKIRSRGRKDDICIDLHVTVDKSMTVDESHNLSHEIEKDIKNKIFGVSEVEIHIEPA